MRSRDADKARYLSELRERLEDSAVHDVASVLSEISLHIDDALSSGESLANVTAQLGSPAVLAASYADALSAQPPQQRPRARSLVAVLTLGIAMPTLVAWLFLAAIAIGFAAMGLGLTAAGVGALSGAWPASQAISNPGGAAVVGPVFLLVGMVLGTSLVVLARTARRVVRRIA